jgi:hypothetical protein
MGRQERRTAPDRDEDFGGTAADEDSRRAQECNALTDEQDDKAPGDLTFINTVARRELAAAGVAGGKSARSSSV